MTATTINVLHHMLHVFAGYCPHGLVCCACGLCVCVTGSDISRCMMKFAKGKALGPHGLDWLKIHLVNLAGSMKRYTVVVVVAALDVVVM